MIRKTSVWSRRKGESLWTAILDKAYRHALYKPDAGEAISKTRPPRGRYVTDRKGKRTGVVLSIKHYSRLMEDLHDLAVVAERRDDKLVTIDELKKRLHKRGFL